ncbi:MAG: Gfo/Idh/MocA family oxidoreductase [Rhodospirillaceae bacterium]|jgi:predicted dehydrogenase|nr:Gfo/Idh/MocA family oxidoreductase [Rhodospirillaceae bacterium]
MINAAIVGIGRWGQLLVESVQGKSDLIRFTAGVTRTRAKAEEFCAGHKIDLRDDYGELINDSAIDAVVLATPHTQHEEQIIAAAKAGKQIFTEKPFTLSRASAERAMAACKEAGITVAIGHNRRFMKNTEALKAMVEAGELGTILHIDGNQSSDLGMAKGAWRDSRDESPAGGMTSLGIHALDCMIHMGGAVAEVDAISTRRSIGYDVDDATAVLVRFASGATGTLTTLASGAKIWHLRVAGSEGWAETRDNKTLTVCRKDGVPEDITFDSDAYPHLSSIAGELNEFAAAVQGQGTYRISLDEILNATSVLEAITQSASSGGRVRIG